MKALLLTLSAAFNFRLLQVGEADEDGLANVQLLLSWGVFHSTAAAPGLQQLLQHLNQRTQFGLKWIFSIQRYFLKDIFTLSIKQVKKIQILYFGAQNKLCLTTQELHFH